MTRTARSARFCERLGIDQPIVLAPMGGGPSTPELVAAVSGAGGLGSIAAGYLTATQLGDAIERARRLTTASLGINLFVPPPVPPADDLTPRGRAVLTEIADELGAEEPAATPSPEGGQSTAFERQLDVAARSDAALVSFTFGLPPDGAIERLQRTGKVVGGTANTLAEAADLAAAGCDVVILQGFEAGAHRGGTSADGDRHVGLLALLEEVGGAGLDVDVIASGGITTGRGVAACLALGAVAAQIGTAFLVAEESGATPEWKKAVLTSVDVDTVVTSAVTGRAARGVRNELVERLEPVADELPAYPVLNSYTAGIRQRAKEIGDPGHQSLWSGQAGGAAREGSAAEIMATLIAELDEAIASLRTGR